MGIQSSFSSIIILAWLTILLRSTDTLAAVNVEDTTVSNKDYTHALSHRQLQLFGSRAYCLSRGRNIYETVRPFFLFRIFYLFQRRGSCGDLCDDLCDHDPCFSDLEVSSNGDKCTCIDGGTYKCGSNTRCTSNDECVCLDGTSGFPDREGCNEINECLSDNICKAPAAVNCTNTFGSYKCVCAQGYEWKDLPNRGCVDVNECTVNPGICGPPSINLCTNQPGSYSCSCTNGYQGTSPNCTDINECTAPASPCRDKQVCVNTIGSFECSCLTGYIKNPAGDCVDVNECLSTNPSVCKTTTEQCSNTEGGYVCKCAEGYFDNDPSESVLLCVDKDECATNSNVCGNKQVCVNSPGSYVCNCISGYIKNSAGDCVDVNECLQTNPAVCKQTTEVCLNNEGGYECLCAKGYSDNDPSGAVLSCVDINECVANVTNATNVCGNNSDCTNIPGNYTCRCKRGYPLTGQSCTPTECTNNGVICGYDALCDIVNNTDTNKTIYSCKCPIGYGGNASDACFDIDECAQNATICSATDEICVNKIPLYRCAKKDWSVCNDKSVESECLPSSLCGLKSRSEQSTTVCCSTYESCGDKKCCNGAYTLNQPCPSKNANDCRSGLKCARANATTLTYVCCEDSSTPLFSTEPVCR